MMSACIAKEMGFGRGSAHNSSPIQVLERSRRLSKDEMIQRLCDGKAVSAEAVGSLNINQRISTPERYGFVGLTSQLDNNLKTYKKAMLDIDSTKWLEARKSKMDSMGSNQVRTLVDPPKGLKPVACKWVYKRKLGADGEVTAFKAKLVAKGYTVCHSSMMRRGLAVHRPRPDSGMHDHHQRHYFPHRPRGITLASRMRGHYPHPLANISQIPQEHQLFSFQKLKPVGQTIVAGQLLEFWASPKFQAQTVKNEVNRAANPKAAATIYCDGLSSVGAHKRKLGEVSSSEEPAPSSQASVTPNEQQLWISAVKRGRVFDLRFEAHHTIAGSSQPSNSTTPTPSPPQPQSDDLRDRVQMIQRYIRSRDPDWPDHIVPQPPVDPPPPPVSATMSMLPQMTMI
ncbi:hypothetical protein Sango_2720500 [Sesamum angolense]|uniref:Reverse transcriptase Ty1/copia-type domain-containing protein n=1 Tax=Sesamum angolense TaxID=2727404 RepID=A0AAE1W353_9LAMI|nr:hypothetical protein Sango_2720500 [Sesamum angolense]